MPVNLYAVHARALANFQAKQGTSGLGATCPQFIWNGSQWAISPNTAKTSQKLTTGGVQIDFSLRFSVLCAQFFTPTVTTADQVRALMLQNGGTTMSYLGGKFISAATADNYKITDVEISPNGLVLTIDANSVNQAA